MTWLAVSVITAYVAVIALVSLYSRRYTNVRDPVDYFIASHRLSGFVSAMTYAATTYSAFMLIGLTGLSYATGVGALAFELAYLVFTVVILTLVGTRVWELSKANGYVTPTQLLGDYYGVRLATAFIVIYTFIALIPYSAIQVLGPAVILSTVTGGFLDVPIALAVAAAVILVSTYIAGFRSVAWTDALQGIIMLSGTLALVLWLAASVPASIFEELASKDLLNPNNSFWTPRTFFAYTTPWIFFAITNPQVFQRTYAPRDRGAYARMVLLFAFFGLTYTILSVMIGLLARGGAELGLLSISVNPTNQAEWNLVTPKLLLNAPLVLAILTSMSIFASATSTVNSIVLTLASMISTDMPGLRKHKLFVGKLLIPVFIVLLYAFSYLRPGFVVNLAVTSSTLLLPLLPIYLGAIYRCGGKLSYIATSIVGSTAALTITTLNPPLPMPKEVVIVAISCLTYLAASTLSPRKS